MKLTCKHPGGPGQLLYFEMSLNKMNDDRWDPEYYNPKYNVIFRALKGRKARPLGESITHITYGQVGERHLSPRGTVRYLQVINLQETGIDFALKPDRIKEGSHNDPERSRVLVGDLLLSNTSFGGMSQLLGRCVAVVTDYGKINISQDIDVIRVKEIDATWICAFLKGKYGQEQMARLQHGVKSFKISFNNVKEVLVPKTTERVREEVRAQYLAMNRWHEKAMARKEELAGTGGRAIRGKDLGKLAERDPACKDRIEEARRRLRHLVGEVERWVAGETETIRRYPD